MHALDLLPRRGSPFDVVREPLVQDGEALGPLDVPVRRAMELDEGRMPDQIQCTITTGRPR